MGFYGKTSDSGFGLVELLLVIGLISIVGLGLAQIISNVHQDTAGIQERLAILDLQKTISTLTNGKNLCEKSFTDTPANFTFDVTAFPPANGVELPALFMNVTDADPIAKEAGLITIASGLSTDQIWLKNIQGGGNSFTADLSLSFKGRSIFAKKPISTKVQLNGSISAGKITLVSCVASSGSGQAGVPSTKPACESVGGAWVEPTGGRPKFCSLSGDIIEWY
jgi:type II secretory pathway pseudopilin PulG